MSYRDRGAQSIKEREMLYRLIVRYVMQEVARMHCAHKVKVRTIWK